MVDSLVDDMLAVVDDLDCERVAIFGPSGYRLVLLRGDTSSTHHSACLGGCVGTVSPRFQLPQGGSGHRDR